MKNKVIVLIGPTGVGKTKTAITLAKMLHTEIISSDSMQIYRHMDIGTGKPSPEELSSVRHHMINIVEPSEEYSVGRYIEEVVPIIDDLLHRGLVPIVTGGTGLYLKAMTRGLFKGPSADWQLRERLLEEEKEKPGSLYEQLKKLDPEAASAIKPNDLRRILRALEVCITGGLRFSEAKERFTSPLPYDFLKIGLLRSRNELYEMLDRRVDEMLRQGLLEEAKRVLSMGPSRTARQAIGYKELFGFIEGDYSLEEAVRLIKRNTRRYAKRQFTWFSREEHVFWVDITGLFDSGPITQKLIASVPTLRDIITSHGKIR